MSELSILYLNSSGGWGGMEMHPLEVAQEVAGRGSTVLFALKKGATAELHSRGRGFAPVPLRASWYLDPASLTVLRRMADAFRINVIHIHAPRDAWRGLVLSSRLRRRPVLVFSRHLGSPAGKRKDDFLHRLLAGRLDAMVAVSGYIRDNILESYPIERSKVKVIPYGLGPAVRGSAEGGREVRRLLQVPADKPLIGMVAQVTPDKRQDLLVSAAARVRKVFPECTFVLAGAPLDPAYELELRKLISSQGLAGNVHLTGFWKDVPSLMQALNLLVLPSKAEAFGLVLLEAMANARAILGSRSGAIPEVVKHGENGLLFEPGSAESLAEALLEMLRDPDKQRQMGAAGEKMFDRSYRLEREAASLEELYRTLIRVGQGQAPMGAGSDGS
jgi:glycosyltransferase involved in cell wall biosynthesis